jgi:AcrR family transcriptional regulator
VLLYGMREIEQRREEERESRVQSILTAARKLFAQYGVENSSVAQIGREARLSRTLVYFYFDDREHIYLSVMEEALSGLLSFFLEAVQDLSRGIDRVEALGRAYFQFTEENLDYYRVLAYFQAEKWDQGQLGPKAAEVHGRVMGLADRVNQFLAGEIRQGQEDGSIQKDLDPLQGALTVWSMTSGVIQTLSSKGEMFEKAYGLGALQLRESCMNMLRKALEG